MINSDVAKTTYTTVPGATEYAIGFEYYWNLDDTPQLFVTLNGEELVYGADYTISGDGLNVVLATEPDEPATLIITRNVPFTQTSDYVIGRIDPDQIERDFDLAMMRTQQNKETIDTAVDIVNDCVDEVSELKSDVEETIDDVEQAVRDAEAAAETAASYETRLSNVEAVIPEGASPEDLLALKSEVDLAANSGDQLTNKGVWYAKMYAATMVPTGAEYDGKNYADFSQVDGNGNPIIVLYEGQSGAWVQTQTITPPADYNGYVTVTSKIWDIVEQAGQQGGQVLWSHNTKTFTPYPKIVSFENAALTGNSTVTMPVSSNNDNITNKGYVDAAIASAVAGYDTPELFDWKWRDATTARTTWKLSDGNWISKADAESAYQHLIDDRDGITTVTLPYVTVNSTEYLRDDAFDVPGADYPYAYIRINYGTVLIKYSTSATGELSATYYDGPNSGATGAAATAATTVTVRPVEYETIAGVTIAYYRGNDGHKITPTQISYAYGNFVTGQETAVDTIYAATGIAWYYLIRTYDQKFKLPRAKPLNGAVIGTDHAITVTDGTKYGGLIGINATYNPISARENETGQVGTSGTAGAGLSVGKFIGLSKDPTKSGIIAERNNTDQYKYLYFYVGA